MDTSNTATSMAIGAAIAAALGTLALVSFNMESPGLDAPDLPSVNEDRQRLFHSGSTTPIAGQGVAFELSPTGWAITQPISQTERSSAGATSGLSFAIDETFEALASGQQVTVEVSARLSSDDMEFVAAYSTNEVGNSGWQRFTANTEFSVYTFEYNVPQMRAGRLDYVGVELPAEYPDGTLELQWIRISVPE